MNENIYDFTGRDRLVKYFNTGHHVIPFIMTIDTSSMNLDGSMNFSEEK